MIPNRVTATQAVRSFAKLIDHVRFTHHAIAIIKGNQVIAELSPPPKTGFPVSQLATFLSQLPKLRADRALFSKTLKTVRNSAKLPENPWD